MCPGLRWVSQQPECHGGIGAAGTTWILANTEHRRTVLVLRVEGETFLKMLAGSG
jgi:hypothetical protein